MHFQCKALASPFRLFIPATLEQVREPGTFSPLSAITYGLLVHSGSVQNLEASKPLQSDVQTEVATAIVLISNDVMTQSIARTDTPQEYFAHVGNLESQDAIALIAQQMLNREQCGLKQAVVH